MYSYRKIDFSKSFFYKVLQNDSLGIVLCTRAVDLIIGTEISVVNLLTNMFFPENACPIRLFYVAY